MGRASEELEDGGRGVVPSFRAMRRSDMGRAATLPGVFGRGLETRVGVTFVFGSVEATIGVTEVGSETGEIEETFDEADDRDGDRSCGASIWDRSSAETETSTRDADVGPAIGENGSMATDRLAGRNTGVEGMGDESPSKRFVEKLDWAGDPAVTDVRRNILSPRLTKT